MKGITFGNHHSYNDLKLILESKEIGSPEVKVRKIDIEGADSSLDLTDFFGEPKYEDVTHKFSFSTIVPQAQFLSLFSTVKNALHGKKKRIILDDDPLFFYLGRIKVLPFTNEKNIGKISVECDCEPYKYKLEKTVVSTAVNGTKTISLTNGRKRAVPEITTTASMTISFGGHSWASASGTFTLPELELVEGVNTVTVTGTGTITFTWQEGNL
jgi:phage-related protein